MSSVDKLKVVFVTNIAAPYEMRFVPELNFLCQVQYLFHSMIGDWRTDMCLVRLTSFANKIRGPIIRISNRYYAPLLVLSLIRINPTVIIADDFFNPSTLVCLIYAKLTGKKIIIRSETIRKKGVFFLGSSLRCRLIKYIYSSADAIMAVSQEVLAFKSNISKLAA